jgi:hypothetical protein
LSSCTSAISNASRFLQQGVLKKKKKKLICTQGRRKLKGVENGCSRKNRFIGPPSPQEGFKEKGMIFLTVTSIFHCTKKTRKKISYALKEEESSKALTVVARGRRG